MHIQLSLSLHLYLLYFLLNSCDGNDAFWRHSMLVKQSSSFSRKHRILSLQICVRQTVQLTRKPDRLPSLATDAGTCVHCTRHLSATRATWCNAFINDIIMGKHNHKTSKLSVNGVVWMREGKRTSLWTSAKLTMAFSEPPTVYRGKRVISRPFHRSYLKANKMNNSEGIKKFENAYHFWKCADAVYEKL